jgi:hypothetical protein
MATRKSSSGRRYGRKASKKVERAMRERKRGTLRTGSGKKVTSRKQAIAIGLSEARSEGAKVPPAKKGGEKKSSSSKGNRKSTKKRARKGPAKRSTRRKK